MWAGLFHIHSHAHWRSLAVIQSRDRCSSGRGDPVRRTSNSGPSDAPSLALSRSHSDEAVTKRSVQRKRACRYPHAQPASPAGAPLRLGERRLQLLDAAFGGEVGLCRPILHVARPEAKCNVRRKTYNWQLTTHLEANFMVCSVSEKNDGERHAIISVFALPPICVQLTRCNMQQ